MRTFKTATLVFGIGLLRSTLLYSAETTPPADSILGARVAELMEVGFDRGPKPLAASERLYQSLKNEAPKDPRVDYAQGLVLWKQMKNKEAQALFLAATQASAEPYLPAWRALIWTCFVAKTDDVGYARLFQFAKLVANTNRASQPSNDADAIWIGNVMAALELTLETNQRREAWLQAQEKLTEILGQELMEGYLSGKAEVHARHSLLETEILQAREKAKLQREEQLEKKQLRLQKSLESVQQKRESLKKSKAEMREAYTEKVADYQKRMERLEKDYDMADRRSSTLLGSMAVIDQQVTILQHGRRQQNPGNANRTDQAVAQLMNQRAVLHAEFMRAVAAAEQIAASAQLLTQAQAELVDQYQQATGEIVAEDASAEKWKERTLKQAGELKKAEAKAKAKTPVPKAKILLAKSFRTYVDLDLNVERAHVLDSFGLISTDHR